MRLSPAEIVIKSFGGVHATSRAIGRSASAISLWKKKDGLVPSSILQTVLLKARELNLDLCAEDLILGREI
jgi:hypothetical protein